MELSPLFMDLAAYQEDDKLAADELLAAVNRIIGKHRLPPAVVLSLLARFTAGYIHITQKWYDKRHADEVVEEDFQNMLTATLTDLDMSDVSAEMEKIQKEQLN